MENDFPEGVEGALVCHFDRVDGSSSDDNVILKPMWVIGRCGCVELLPYRPTRLTEDGKPLWKLEEAVQTHRYESMNIVVGKLTGTRPMIMNDNHRQKNGLPRLCVALIGAGIPSLDRDVLSLAELAYRPVSAIELEETQK